MSILFRLGADLRLRFSYSIFAVLSFLVLVSCGKDSPTQPRPPAQRSVQPSATLQGSRIIITPSSVNLTSIGQTAQLTASVLDQFGQSASGAVVAWSSSDEEVATVSSQGLVTAVTKGTATVTARTGSVSATTMVTVLVPMNDRDVLVSFYESAGGRHWTVKSNWLSRQDLATWYGVTVDTDGRVTGINLPNNNLRGTIASELGSLEELVSLRINHNRLTGHIPRELGRLTKLRHLVLSSNQLTGVIPAGLGQLTGLEELVLSFNRLSGSIPEELGDLKGLTRLSLSVNELNGPIPSELGRLKQLTSLRLDQNRLSGPIPLNLGGMTVLRSMVLSDNQLTGFIPAHLSLLDHLEELALDHNRLGGGIPSQLGLLANLKRLGLAGNRLSGGVPAFLGRLTGLTHLHLFSNPGLSGILPRSFTRLKLAELLLEGTRLCVPQDDDYAAWLEQIPVKTVATCANLESSVLASLYSATNGHNWANNTNWLSDRPLGAWHGVTTDAQGHVTRINLTNNNLSGSVPGELAGLSKLKSLNLSTNGFLSGPLPPELINLGLRELQLEDTRLCAPPDAEFQTWLQTIPARSVSTCDDLDLNTLKALFALFNDTNGLGWHDRTNWNSDALLEEWYGITTDAEGRITELNLAGNNLSGSLPADLAALTELERLDFSDNEGLTGPLPHEWTALTLEYLRVEGTQLCAPPDTVFQTWLDKIPEYSIADCAETITERDRDVLVLLYRSTNGKDWENSDNWLSEAPLDQWYGVATDGEGSVTALELIDNSLTGEFPPSLGELSRLTWLVLDANNLSGPIPVELGQLTDLTSLDLTNNNLSGPIPTELGQLTGLTWLGLSNNNLSGPIPTELGQLTDLTWLGLDANNLSGPIPVELGQLTDLTSLNLTNNNLSGPIPAELGQLTDLTSLDLHGNNLSGPIPVELGQLTDLTSLNLSFNGLSGSIPHELGQLTSLATLVLGSNPLLSGALTESITKLQLETLQLGNTALCLPMAPAFQIWLQNIQNHRVASCFEFTGATAYMTQAAQSLTHPVPLVAGEAALLRVFITADSDVGASMPPVQAVFFNGNQIVHSVEIPAQDLAVPEQIEEGALMYSANAEIPGTVVMPGLELVVNIDSAGSLDAESNAIMRIPETGRQLLDVRTVSPFNLTLVPFLWMESPHIAVLAETDGLTADDDLFWQTRNLLPIADFEVEVREPVWTATDPVIHYSNDILRETKAIRVLDDSDDYYLGILRAGGGQAELPGTSSVSVLDAEVIAHEIGHNLNLYHAPCGRAYGPDQFYPYGDGSIGSWGYDFRHGTLVAPGTADLMSYCHPQWISDYGFTRAMNHRGTVPRVMAAVTGSSSKGLLVWGGVNAEGELELEPGFAVDSAPSVPSLSGPYRLTGHSAEGNVLFTVDFGMPELGDGPGNVFAFVLPVQPGWTERLYSITLTGPEGVVSIDRDGDRGAALLLDRDTGSVRGILRDWLDPSGVSPSTRPTLPEPGLEIVVSPGIPDPESW